MQNNQAQSADYQLKNENKPREETAHKGKWAKSRSFIIC